MSMDMAELAQSVLAVLQTRLSVQCRQSCRQVTSCSNAYHERASAAKLSVL
jgi:hypothetical protein